jgi:hypothetical protein
VGHTCNSRSVPSLAAALLALVPACAALGPPRATGPCDERFELEAAAPAEGLELAGRIRMEFPPYRLRGLVRIVCAPGGRAARLDVRQSGLFGAVEEDMTVCIGDTLAILDRGAGRLFGNDSSLALIEQGVGERVEAADILAAFLFAPPRCAELREASVERRGDSWVLQGYWRGRRIEVRGAGGEGIRELRECFPGAADCWIVRYGPLEKIGEGPGYPRWIRLSRDRGDERVTLELIGMKSVTDEFPPCGGDGGAGLR